MSDSSRNGPTLSRREMTQLTIAVSAGLAAAPFTAANAADHAEPFKDAGDTLRAFMRLQSRVDDGYTSYFNAGTVYAVLAGRQSIPMYGYEGLLRFHTRVAGAGRYEVTFIEAGTYLDLATGQRMDRFQNPITGVENVVRHIVEGPMSWRWTRQNLGVTSPLPILRRRVAWQHFEGESWMHFDNLISLPGPGGVRHAAALVTYVGKTVEMLDAKRVSVADTVLIDSSINPWAPWLAMGEDPGRLANNIIGRKLGALSEAPDRLIKYIAASDPHVLEGVERWAGQSATERLD